MPTPWLSASHLAPAGLLLALLLTSDLTAQGPVGGQAEGKTVQSRATPPSAAEIAAVARAGTLDNAGTVAATILGKPFRFTPARSAPSGGKKGRSEAFIGVLENGAAGDETGLPVGKWNIYVANVAGSLRGYAESGGQVRSAIRTTISESSAVGPAGFVERGWCVYTYYWDILAFAIGRLRVCF